MRETFEYDFICNFRPDNQFWRDAIKKSLPKEEQTQPDIEQRIDEEFANIIGNFENPFMDIMDACFSVLTWKEPLFYCYYFNDDRYDLMKMFMLWKQVYDCIIKDDIKNFKTCLMQLNNCCSWFQENPLYPESFCAWVDYIKRKLMDKNDEFENIFWDFLIKYPNFMMRLKAI